MISWRMAAAWVAALVVATVLAWQIVGLADSQVGDTPVAVAPSLTTTTEDDAVSTTTSPSTSTSATDAEPTTTTTPGATTSSSTGTSTSTSTAPTSSSSSSSTSATTGSEQWSLRTVTTTGGVVVVRYRTGEVELQAATPAPGFSVEIDDSGPPRVRVEFESDIADVRVEARWDDGALDIDVDDD